MDTSGDSDTSEGMQELVDQGFAIKWGREHLAPDPRYSSEARTMFRDSDTSHVDRPLPHYVSTGVASTHGHTTVNQESVTAANRNTILNLEATFLINMIIKTDTLITLIC